MENCPLMGTAEWHLSSVRWPFLITHRLFAKSSSVIRSGVGRGGGVRDREWARWERENWGWAGWETVGLDACVRGKVQASGDDSGFRGIARGGSRQAAYGRRQTADGIRRGLAGLG